MVYRQFLVLLKKRKMTKTYYLRASVIKHQKGPFLAKNWPVCAKKTPKYYLTCAPPRGNHVKKYY